MCIIYIIYAYMYTCIYVHNRYVIYYHRIIMRMNYDHICESDYKVNVVLSECFWIMVFQADFWVNYVFHVSDHT